MAFQIAIFFLYFYRFLHKTTAIRSQENHYLGHISKRKPQTPLVVVHYIPILKKILLPHL